ncbi:Pimeloyl-ACP methyl ester carboxylesterase [Nocardioides exalbidus]|uniref:Pimeloyl-ACP methyl ester carboxylesterase n=1 Tax=Nocardioides exalbidus TaxID=402596 RepID=A0A1H4RZV3_9ACTN|nr:alpha/beta hydrolase [Nocardioides exalbidus]SEC37304.1 Pimeloyl-ACP methyl ester carboxylesterase [Nocardioides exalbidus]
MTGWTLAERFAGPQGEVAWDRFGDGPPVVLLHGTPFSSYVWREVAAALAATHTVHVWDMPGYGASEKRGGQDVTLRAQGELFATLLDHWGLDSPAVVAHDFGGAVALRAHLLHGAAYDRLALVDAVTHGPWGTGLFRLAQDHEEVFAALPSEVHEGLVRGYVGTASHRGLRADVLDALVEPWLGERGQAALYRQMAQNDQRWTDELEPLYADVTVPTLVCWGTHDTWLAPEKGERLAAALPRAELHWLQGAGHLAQEDAPAQLTARLVEFLAASEASPRSPGP